MEHLDKRSGERLRGFRHSWRKMEVPAENRAGRRQVVC